MTMDKRRRLRGNAIQPQPEKPPEPPKPEATGLQVETELPIPSGPVGVCETYNVMMNTYDLEYRTMMDGSVMVAPSGSSTVVIEIRGRGDIEGILVDALHRLRQERRR